MVIIALCDICLRTVVLFSACDGFFYLHTSDRFLPDKAIDLLDEAGSRVRLRHAQV